MVQINQNSDWTSQEISTIVRSYLDMLSLELAGQRYSKTNFRNLLLEQLNGKRSKGSVEFKHCNISAAMKLLGYPSIQGYKPRSNFQKDLLDEVIRQIATYRSLDQIVQSAVMQPAQVPLLLSFHDVPQQAPQKRHHVAEPLVQYVARHPSKRDFLAQEARNQSLGLAGERFVVAYECWKLEQHGLHALAKKVEHVSQTQGDGLGFDVRSFDLQGHEQLIEVKTTSFAKETPFFLSQNELKVSQAETQKFHLRRVYSFRTQPRFFTLQGDIAQHCCLDPVTYRASF